MTMSMLCFLKRSRPFVARARPRHERAVDARAAITEAPRAGNHFLVKTFSAAHDGLNIKTSLPAVRTADAVEDLAARQRGEIAGELDAVLLPIFE